MERPNFEDVNKESSEPATEEIKENPFTKMNKERVQKEYDDIKLKIDNLNQLLDRRNSGAQDLDSEIDSLKYSLKSSVEEFARRNPNSPLSDPLKKMVGMG